MHEAHLAFAAAQEEFGSASDEESLQLGVCGGGGRLRSPAAPHAARGGHAAAHAPFHPGAPSPSCPRANAPAAGSALMGQFLKSFRELGSFYDDIKSQVGLAQA